MPRRLPETKISDFKIGDRVRVIDHSDYWDGTEGVIISIDYNDVIVRNDEYHRLGFDAYNLEKL